MIKNSRYIIRRVIIGVLISLILSFIYACDVKAETLTSSASINYNHTGNETGQVIYQGSGYWANQGQGQLEFTMIVYKESSNTSFSIPLISGIVVRSGDNNMYECTYGSIDLEYSQSGSNMKGYIVPVICNMVMGSSGLTKIGVTFTGSNNTWTTQTSGVFTFTKDGSAIISDRVSYIFSYLQDWVYPRLQDIITSTTSTRDYLSYIYDYLQNYIYIRMGALESAINNQSSQAHNDSQAEIDAANQNTQEQIDSQKVCNKIRIDKNKTIDEGYLTINGTINTNITTYGVTDYIEINSDIKILNVGALSNYMCFYGENYSLINCNTYNNLKNSNNIITKPGNVKYARFTININTNLPTLEVESCKNGNQANNDAINDVNDTLNDSNVSIDTLPSDNINMGPISSLVTLPITALNNIVNAFNGSCTPFNIGSLLGTNLVFPCINIESLIGSFLWNTIDIIVTGIFIFSIRQRFVDLFYKLVTLKDIGLKGGF